MSIRIKYNDEEFNYFTVTLQEKSQIELPTGGTYQLKLSINDIDYINDIDDLSLYPDEFNRFKITTFIESGVTESNYPLEYEGWYDYEFSNGDIFETGKCYVFDNEDNVENTVESISHNVDKDKYVYKK